MKTVLIIWGGWPGHDPAACADFFAAQLSSRGFKVELSDSLSVLDDAAKLAQFALVVPMWTMGTLTDQQEKNFVEAVAGGTGLAGFHGGMGDAFRGRIDYQWMVGGQFVSHPDDLQYYQVTIVNRPDRITDGIDDFTVRTEQYYMLVDPRNEVLATTVMRSRTAPWVDGVVVPVMWKKMHGAGRVFYSALGHQCAEFKASPPQLELTLRGMEWAAR